MMSRGQQSGISTHAATAHFVIVTCVQRCFALDAEVVQGIIDTGDVAQSLVPMFHGEAYPVIDLASRLAIKGIQNERCGQIVLFTRGQFRGSLGVERVHGRMDLHASQILPLPPHFQGAERDWYRGMILFEGSVAVILHSNWLLQSVAEMRQA